MVHQTDYFLPVFFQYQWYNHHNCCNSVSHTKLAQRTSAVLGCASTVLRKLGIAKSYGDDLQNISETKWCSRGIIMCTAKFDQIEKEVQKTDYVFAS